MPDDAEIGRMVRERNEAQQRVNQLAEEARRIGERLAALANLLRSSPDLIKFEGTPFPMEYLHKGQSFKTSEIDGKAISEVSKDYREWLLRLEDLNAKTAAYGL